MADVPASPVELIDRLLANSNELRIAEPAPDERAAWRRLIFAVLNSPAVPEDLRLRHTGRDRGDLILRLVPDTPENAPRPPAHALIPVPERLTKPHAVIAATREQAKRATDDGWIDTRNVKGVLHVRVATDSLRRALVLVQALIDEAVRRGYGVTPGNGYRCPGGLAIAIDGHDFEISVFEETDRVAHQPRKYELEHAARNSWFQVPEWDRVPSGRLQLYLGHDTNSGKRLAGDRTRWRLEERLGLALESLEQAAAEAEAQRLDQERREREQRQTWERAMEAARQEWRESVCARHLREQVADWVLARDMRELIKEARTQGRSDRTWLFWAANYCEAVDPLVQGLKPPEDREPTPEELAPYLDGWSPHGPHRRASLYG